MSKRTVLNLRLTEEEKADWQRQADYVGVSLAELVRRRMKGGDPQTPVTRPQDYPKPPTRPVTRAAGPPPPSRKAVPSPVVPDFTKGKS